MSRVDTWETIVTIGRHATIKGLSAYSAATNIDRLARIARTLHRLYEFQCNEPIEICAACDTTWIAGELHAGKGTGRHIPSQCFYARLERLESRAVAIGAELGIVVTTQRDPRGAAVKIWADKEEGRMLGCFS